MIRVCLFLVLLTVAGCSSNTEKTATSPNIIWLVAEDQSPDFFPMYGDKTVSLPHLEALAKDGITFNNAYALCRFVPQLGAVSLRACIPPLWARTTCELIMPIEKKINPV